MTRFKDTITDFNQPNLSENSRIYLTRYLRSFIERKTVIIRNIVNNFIESGKDYEVYELSSSIVIVLNLSEKTNISINIGYPFPIYSEDTTQKIKFISKNRKNVDVKIHIRGEILRERQRDLIKKTLKNTFKNVKWFSITNIGKFRKISYSILNRFSSKNELWIYVDPYNFIGDSFVGLYFIDYLKRKFGIKKIIVLSNTYKHTRLFYKSYPKTSKIFKKFCKKSNIVIMPDLIDNHLSRTIKLLQELKNENVFIFLLGRNLIIKIKDKKCLIFHYDKNDILLRNKNIENYMDDCLFPYINLDKKFINITFKKIIKAKKANKIFINPHSSTPLKQIPVDLVLGIAKNIIQKRDVTIYISKGRLNIKNNQDWIKSCLDKLKNKKYKSIIENIIFLSDQGLADLGLKLRKLQISSALTADTAITHILSRILIPNITIYNEGFWDCESPQSLSAESPLGFCRFYLPQYPAILNKNINQLSFVKSISNGLITLSSNNYVIHNDFVLNKIIKFNKQSSGYLDKSNRKTLDYNDHKKLYRKYIKLKNYCKNSNIFWLFDIFDPNNIISGIIAELNSKTLPLIYSAWKILPLHKFLSFSIHHDVF